MNPISRVIEPSQAARPLLGSPLRMPAPRAELVSPELALIDASLRSRLLDGLPEPGAFQQRVPLGRLPAFDGGLPVNGLVHAGGYARESGAASRERRGARTRGLPTVVAVAGAFAVVALVLSYVERRSPLPIPARSASSAQPVLVTTPTSPATRTKPARSTTTPRAPAHPAAKEPFAGRTFAWAAAAGVQGYEVQFFRGSKRVFVRRLKAPKLVLPDSWLYAGRSQALSPGVYRWYVWPLRGTPARRDSAPLVQTSFTVADTA
jgi:hypothetical protein